MTADGMSTVIRVTISVDSYTLEAYLFVFALLLHNYRFMCRTFKPVSVFVSTEN
jgi:hypothetical protein